MCVCVHTSIHPSVRPSVRLSIHTYMHAYIHAYNQNLSINNLLVLTLPHTACSTPILHHLFSVSCFPHAIFTFLLLLVGRKLTCGVIRSFNLCFFVCIFIIYSYVYLFISICSAQFDCVLFSARRLCSGFCVFSLLCELLCVAYLILWVCCVIAQVVVL